MSVARLVAAKNFHRMAAETPERWEALAKTGFKADPFGDIQHAINVKLGGFYIDVGAGKLITDGKIKIKSDGVPVAYTEEGLVCNDGSMLPADVVVLATGFLGNLKEHVERLLGKEVADRAGDCFGVDEEGELHGVFKPTGRKLLNSESIGDWVCKLTNSFTLCYRSWTLVYWRWHGAFKILFSLSGATDQGAYHGQPFPCVF